MEIETLDVSSLSSGQKILLMERLWRSLAGDPLTGAPGWHDEVIKSRALEWEERKQVSEEWKSVREELRRELL